MANFIELVDLSARVAATTRRHEKIERIAAWLRTLSGREITLGVRYLSGQVPQGRIGIGGAMLHAVRQAPMLPVISTLEEIDRRFEALAATSGSGSTTSRRRQLMELFERCTVAERDFLARLIIGELRQGALEGVMVEALARAAKTPVEEIHRALMVSGDLGAVAQAVLTAGSVGARGFALQLMQPLRPMLAQPVNDVEEALSQIDDAVLEFKLDGARLQVHKSGEHVRVFSRRMNDVTDSVPELTQAVRELRAQRIILDGEAIVLHPSGRPRPFQETMRRFGRKQDVQRLREELPLSAFYFDCLHYDGEDLIGKPARERFRALSDALPERLVVPRRFESSQDIAEAFMHTALAQGHEGIMVKSLSAPYEAGSRASTWFKVKAAYSLDLVILAAEWGHGRRDRWLSNLHLGARGADGSFVMLGKTFKGMTDEMLAWQTERLLGLAVERDASTVYVRPELVVEVAINGIQASPHYPAGLALRFARVKRYRNDKSPAQADTVTTVRSIYESGIAAGSKEEN